MQKFTTLFPTSGLILLFLVSVFWISCGRGENETLGESCLTLSAKIAQTPGTEAGEAEYEKWSDLVVPPLPPEKALEKFSLEEGFRIEVVAAEPMVTSPVAMDIDPDGRLWVVDMPTYMPDEAVEAFQDPLKMQDYEWVPEGRVTVLEDTDGDGKMDTRRIFLDGLVLPRAIKVLNDGILLGEPPNLWFIQDTDGDGKGDMRQRIYSSYGDSTDPNVHGFPAGLKWGMDNWIHSSNTGVSSFRRVDGGWQSRPFERLGQYGMTQDNWGRLYSSNNSRPLQTVFIPYGYSERHPMFEMDAGTNVTIGADEPLWPGHPTGVNRGYRDGMLHPDGSLRKATSISSTTIYRGSQFGEEYVGNAFSPEPAGNMIKRYIVDWDPAEIEGEARFAYEGREFLTTPDERFRPVEIYNSPDGGLYIVDMYRGVLEHASHLTDYLLEYTLEHDLHKANGPYGRIYRVVRDDREIDYDIPKFSEMLPSEAVVQLHNETGMNRDHAQQVLVQCSPPSVVSTLEDLARDESVEGFTRLHALWTLEGYDRSVYDRSRLTSLALQALGDEQPRIRSSAVRILEPAIAQGSEEVMARLEQLASEDPSPFVQLQLLASLGESNEDSALELMALILDNHADSPYFREMALTGVYQREEQLAQLMRSRYGWSEDGGEAHQNFLASLEEATTDQSEVDLSHLTQAQRDLYDRGQQLYRTCMACHGENGEGVSGIGSSLAGSEWVQGEPEALARIVLQGFSGGAAERGEDISAVMPGHSYLPDEDVAAVLTYIRQSWGNQASPVDPEQIARIREAASGHDDLWSPDELRGVSD